MTTRDELIRLIDHLPDEEQAELVARLKTRMRTHGELWVEPGTSHEFFLALQGGATILRVHDVKETRDLIAVWQAVRAA